MTFYKLPCKKGTLLYLYNNAQALFQPFLGCQLQEFWQGMQGSFGNQDAALQEALVYLIIGSAKEFLSQRTWFIPIANSSSFLGLTCKSPF